MSEAAIMQQVRLDLGRLPDLTLWRNSTGALRDMTGRLVRFGLCEGSADLIGLRRITVGPEHLGREMAVFCAIETKAERGKPTPEQVNFLAHVTRMGGLAGIARSPAQARLILGLPE